MEGGVAEIGGGRPAADDGDGDAGAAAGQARQVEDDLPGALRHAEGGDGEVMAPEAQNGQADEGGVGRPDCHRHRNGRPEPPSGVDHEDGDGVAAEAEEDDVAEAGVAGEPADDVPG